ncbi:MAG: hypothetical protein RLZZ09_417, partial [Pseudomonadota bacterium]
SNIVTVHVVLKPQATLLLNADQTGIQIGQTSALSTTGGSGSGAVSYTVLNGPCTVSGTVLSGTGQGSCQVQATKAADSTYASTTSNIVTVHVTSIPQATLVLSANPANIVVNGTSTLSTTGGSGNGSVLYTVLSGPCSIVSNNTIQGTGKGSCQVQASKAADSTYSSTTSNIVTVQVDLIAQNLTLASSTTQISVTGTAALSASGYSGTGSVSYAILSGPCTISSTTILVGASAGSCDVQASIAADNTYSEATSNILTVYVNLNPQATLLLNANPTGIQIGQTSTLSISGGSGTGAVTYAVLSGPCTLSGATLTGASQGDCQVQATKAADSTYSSTTSNTVTVHVDLDPQATLLLTANPTGIDIGQTSALSTSGGSGTGGITYTVLSGPCTISGSTLTGRGQGDCQVQATKAADSTYSTTTSNTVTVHVDLDPQATLTLVASPSSIISGGTSILSTAGGTGNGAVTYAVFSGPCKLNGNIVTASSGAQGVCEIIANKAADGQYSAASALGRIIVASAPVPPNPIPTLMNWEKLFLILTLITTVGWLQRKTV